MDTQDQHQPQNPTTKKRTPRKKARIAVGIIVALVFCFFAAVCWTMRPISATADAYEALEYPGQTVFMPQGAQESDAFEFGLVFYPGARVDPVAYAPLMQKLAAQGWLCILVDAPFHFALLNIDAAAEPIASHSNVAHWYVGGHSLGGVIACKYASENYNQLAGLVLVASRASYDISQTDLHVIGVYGTNDGVLGSSHQNEAIANLPSRYDELVILGANHAQYGNYGEQKGDNPADISREDQQQQTADFIAQSAGAQLITTAR